MKVFKTILRTSLFWILAVAGFRTAMHWVNEDSELTRFWANYLPRSVRHHLIDTCMQEQKITACPVCETTCNALPNNDETAVPENDPSLAVSGVMLLPAPLPAAEETELTTLRNRVDTLENQFRGLVQELNSIFATPQAQNPVQPQLGTPAPQPVAIEAQH